MNVPQPFNLARPVRIRQNPSCRPCDSAPRFPCASVPIGIPRSPRFESGCPRQTTTPDVGVARAAGWNSTFPTESGGCGLDIDTEEEYDAVRERFVEWSTGQRMRAEALYGPLSAELEEGSP